MTKRIRVFFINCPSLATDAATFLILAQNKVQTAIQFEVHHFWIYSLKSEQMGWWNKALSKSVENFHSILSRRERKGRKRLDLRAAPLFRKTLELNSWESQCQEAIDRYDSWLSKSGYNTHDCGNDPAIVITETLLSGRYMSDCGQRIALISAAKWKDFFKPASALEFILSNVQRLSLRLCYGPIIGSHYPTRGCLWDFDVHQPDIKMFSFLGFLCETCRDGLKNSLTTNEYEEISRLIQNTWVGHESDPSSIAGILKKNYKYPLSGSTGLHPGLWAKVSESIQSEFGKFIFKCIVGAIILVSTIVLARYFQDIANYWMGSTPNSSSFNRNAN